MQIGVGFVCIRLSVGLCHKLWSKQIAKPKETFTMVFSFFSSSSPRDEVEEKHKSSSYHRHSYHLLQHDSQDASAEQRYRRAQPCLALRRLSSGCSCPQRGFACGVNVCFVP